MSDMTILAMYIRDLEDRLSRLERQDKVTPGGGGGGVGFSDAEGDPALVGTTADGTSTYAARRDHVHALAAADVLAKLLTVDGTASLLDADKLDGQEGAYYLPSGSYTAADVLTKIKTVDGSASGLDADYVDGLHGAELATAGHTHTELAASNLLTALSTVDGAASGLDADLLDGSHASAFATSSHAHSEKLDASAYTAADVLTKIKTVDGAGSGLDADKLDGVESTAFLQADGSNKLTAALDTAAGVTLEIKQDGTSILKSLKTSVDSYLNLGNGRTADGSATLRLIGDTTYTGYGAAIQRASGANGVTQFMHRGTGNLSFVAVEAAAWIVATSNIARLTIAADGAATFTVSIAVPTLIIGVAHTLTRSAASGAFVSTAERITLADNAELSLGMFIGTVEITDITNGNVALFAVRGGVNAVQEIYDPSGIFTGVKGSATSFNVYYEAGEYKLQNKRGASKVIATHVRTA